MGAHERHSHGRRRRPSHLPDLRPPCGLVTVMPQRERITFLVQLARVLARQGGISAALDEIESYPVLKVTSMRVPGRPVTVGCCYRAGAWWFFDVRTREFIRLANEVSAAAHQIKIQTTERKAAA